MAMKRYWLGLGAVVLLLGGVGLAVLLVPREPVYQGRPISVWIQELTGPVANFAGAVASPTLPRLLAQTPGPEILPYLRATLHRGNSTVSRLYVRWYPRLPPPLVRRLPAPNPLRDTQLRYRAGLILYYMGPTAAAALPDLRDALRDESPEVRRIAATALGVLGPAARSAAPALLRALQDPMPDVRRAALRALPGVENDPARLVPAIADRLKDADPGVRTDAAEMLKDAGPKAELAVPALIRALEDPDNDVFIFAAQALGRIGPSARAAVPALERALRAPRPYSETTLRWALQQLQPQP